MDHSPPSNRYLVNLDVKAGNPGYSVVDYVGESFEATVLSNGSVQFTLDDDFFAVGLTGTTEEEEVELTYKAEVLSRLEEVASTTQAPAPSKTEDAGY